MLFSVTNIMFLSDEFLNCIESMEVFIIWGFGLTHDV